MPSPSLQTDGSRCCVFTDPLLQPFAQHGAQVAVAGLVALFLCAEVSTSTIISEYSLAFSKGKKPKLM